MMDEFSDREYALLTDEEIRLLKRLLSGKKKQSFSSDACRSAISDRCFRTGDEDNEESK